jgi:hypothetical protein
MRVLAGEMVAFARKAAGGRLKGLALGQPAR